MSAFYSRVEDEIHAYLYGVIDVDDGIPYSEYKLKKRIALFEAKQYPTGKVDELGRYQYWFDIITPRRNDEVKNLRVDSDNFDLKTSKPTEFFPHTVILNEKKVNFLEDNGYAAKLKEDVEVFSGWGNVLWERVGNKWERVNLRNTYLTNTLAETVNDTDVIRRHLLTASQLRKMKDWDKVEDVIKHCGNRYFASTVRTSQTPKAKKYYEVFERTGEVTRKEFNELKGIEGGSEDEVLYAKVFLAGLKRGEKAGKFVLFCEEIKSMEEVYMEAHRGPYKGKWMREGMYELLFDYQVRANEIGLQIANGLEAASRTLYRSTDVKTFQNVLSDIEDGQIIDSGDLQQVSTRLEGMDQLVADWNRNLQEADRIANSFEITRGEELDGDVPFRMGLLIDQNNNKLFITLRQRLVIPFRKIFSDWVLPEMVKELNGEEVVRIANDSILAQLYQNIAKNWIRKNAAKIGPIPQEIRQQLVLAKVAELTQGDGIDINVKDLNWKEALKTIRLNISGENDDADEKIADISGFLGVEQRPAVRNYLLDKAYQLRGIDVPETAKAEPAEPGAPAKGSLTREDTIRNSVGQLAEQSV